MIYRDWLSSMFGKALAAVSAYFTSFPSSRDRSATGFYNFCLSSQSFGNLVKSLFSANRLSDSDMDEIRGLLQKKGDE